MQVILLERIEKLGIMGQTVTVKSGYARNFLLPQKKALRATKSNIAYFEEQRTTLEANNLKRRKDAEETAKRMEGLSVILIRQASEMGILFGSVRGKDIADLAAEKGFKFDRNQVNIPSPIKTLGIHSVNIQLHPEVTTPVQLIISQSMDEALVLQKGDQPEEDAEETEDA